MKRCRDKSRRRQHSKVRFYVFGRQNTTYFVWNRQNVVLVRTTSVKQRPILMLSDAHISRRNEENTSGAAIPPRGRSLGRIGFPSALSETIAHGGHAQGIPESIRPETGERRRFYRSSHSAPHFPPLIISIRPTDQTTRDASRRLQKHPNA